MEEVAKKLYKIKKWRQKKAARHNNETPTAHLADRGDARECSQQLNSTGQPGHSFNLNFDRFHN